VVPTSEIRVCYKLVVSILINSHDLPCIFCFRCVEDSAHIFFHCPFSKEVWDAMFFWVGKSLPEGVDGWNHFSLYCNLFKNSKGVRISHLIWLSTTWNIWKLRNDVVFNGVIPKASTLVEDIKSFFFYCCAFVGVMFIMLVSLWLIGVMILWVLLVTLKLLFCIVRDWVLLVLHHNNILLI
jgi:hypothetical protein